MLYKNKYTSPLGIIYMKSDGKYLTGLWFKDSKDQSKHKEEVKEKDIEIFSKTKKWLDIYFSGKIPNFTPPYKLNNVTPFQLEVINIMNEIPYGKCITYGDIAKEIALKKGIKKMSAQAVGNAVGSNPICIIIPCHRVMGKNNNLTGYGGGIENKLKLLNLEKVDTKNFLLPKTKKKEKKRCKWCNQNNEKYIKYHDEEWGVPNYSDKYLLEMLILESFQAGLSWECVLNKRENFRKLYDDFDLEKICLYDEEKIKELENSKEIIRNKRKILASINNAKVFKEIKKEYKTFSNYLETFTKKKIIYETDKTNSPLSDKISKDLTKRNMKFVGTKIIYSYLQAIGVINSHEKECFLHKKK